MNEPEALFLAAHCFRHSFLLQPALKLLRSTVIPWTAPDTRRRLIVARTKLNAHELPEGVALSRRPIKGKRVILKDRRKHGNRRIHIAEWPESNLHEIALPKLACVVSGNADYLLREYSLHCSAGNFILIPPRTPHHRRGPFLEGDHLQNGACTLLFAYAYSHGIYFWLSRSQGTQHVNDMLDNYLIPSAAAVQIFNLLMEEAVAGDDNFEAVCNGLMSAFFTVLAREIEGGRYMHPGPRESSEAPVISSAGFAGQVQEYIEANFSKQLKVVDVALQMYMSPAQFSRRIRQETGTTFIELLTRYRLERAQELLRETDWTATAISGYVGFKSSTYFQDLFRRRLGCTPIEYRCRHDGRKRSV